MDYCPPSFDQYCPQYLRLCGLALKTPKINVKNNRGLWHPPTYNQSLGSVLDLLFIPINAFQRSILQIELWAGGLGFGVRRHRDMWLEIARDQDHDKSQQERWPEWLFSLF